MKLKMDKALIRYAENYLGKGRKRTNTGGNQKASITGTMWLESIRTVTGYKYSFTFLMALKMF